VADSDSSGRTYDSRDAAHPPGLQLWLDARRETATLTESNVLGDLWQETKTGRTRALHTASCPQTARGHGFTRDGTTYDFRPIWRRNVVPCFQSRMNRSLPPLSHRSDPAQCRARDRWHEQSIFSAVFPARCSYSTKILRFLIRTIHSDVAGRLLCSSAELTAAEADDLNGNTLTSVPPESRIQRQERYIYPQSCDEPDHENHDPAGNSISYNYDLLTGNLTNVTDRETRQPRYLHSRSRTANDCRSTRDSANSQRLRRKRRLVSHTMPLGRSSPIHIP